MPKLRHVYYLFAAIATSTFIIIGFKVFEKLKIDTMVAITVNYLVAASLGFWLCRDQGNVASAFDRSWIYLAVISGILLIATFYVYASSAQRSGVAITSVSGKMSAVIPVLLGFLWYNEAAVWNKIVGIVLAILAFWLTFLKKGEKVHNVTYFLPVLLFFGNGLNDSVFKIAQQDQLQGDEIFFLATAFGVSLVAGSLILLIRSIIKRKVPDWKSLLAGVILGLVNWYSTYFFLMGLKYFEVSLFVPIFNVSIVITGAIAGFLIFREKLRPINWIGIALAICAIGLMAI